MTVVAKPIGPRVLVKKLEATELSGSIILPDEVLDRQLRGMVIEVGQWVRGFDEEGPEYAPLGIERGQVVVFGAKDGIQVRLDLAENGQWEDFLVLHINEVLLTLDEAPVRERAS